MRSNQLLWMLVLGFAAYWLFYKKESVVTEKKPQDPKPDLDNLPNQGRNAGNFAQAGNPEGLGLAEIPLAEASISFL